MHLRILLLLISLVTASVSVSHPQTPARSLYNDPKYSFPILGRQSSCPTEQVCGESCCKPPGICDVGAFNWCQTPTADLCESGKGVCPDGIHCCTIGYICDTNAGKCWPPDTSFSADSSSATEVSTTEPTSRSKEITSTSATATSEQLKSTIGTAPTQTTTAPSAGNNIWTEHTRWRIWCLGIVLAFIREI